MTLSIGWEGWRPLYLPFSATSPFGNHLVADDRLVEDASPRLDAGIRWGKRRNESRPRNAGYMIPAEMRTEL